ncbi:MAG: hypothetical protein L0I24_08945 [Pseudonocardia sp.]|nr:hypothetical protein [Pseudonocardia sp.]
MPAGQGLDIGRIAQVILDGLITHWAAAPKATLPPRRMIAPGSARGIAWDGEGLAVSLGGIGVGAAPSQEAGTPRTGNPVAQVLRHAVFVVQLVRCTPESHNGVTPPDAAEVTAAGLSLMRDAGLLSQALTEIASPVRSELGPGGLVVVGAVDVLGPQGGLAAVEATLTATAGKLL